MSEVNDIWPIRFGTGVPTGTAPHGCVYFDQSNQYDEYVFDATASPPAWKPASAIGSGTGTVTGPVSAVVGNLPLWNNVNGKVLSDSGKSISTDGTFAANSDALVPTQRAAKAYTDSVAQGLSVRDSCFLATAAALPANTYANGTAGVGATLTANANGALTVDGVLTIVTDRILVQNEAAPANNGIYVVTAVGDGSDPYVLTRTTDFNSAANILPGSFTFIETGTANAGAGFVLTTTTSPIVVGTTSLTFTQFSGAGEITAGTGLTKSGNTIGDAATAVTPGTYNLVTVNQQGRVTGGAVGTTTGTIDFSIDGGGAQIATGITADLGPWAFDLTLTQVTMLADQAGSIALDLWVAAYSAYPPTVANTIVASDPPTITTATKSQDAALTGWSKTITAGKTLRVNVSSVTTIQRCAVALNYTRNV